MPWRKRKCLAHFNTEQYADIVEDYKLREASSDNSYPSWVFIDLIQTIGAGIWPTLPWPLLDCRRPAVRPVNALTATKTTLHFQWPLIKVESTDRPH